MALRNKYRKILLILAGFGLFTISAGFPGCENQTDKSNTSVSGKMENTESVKSSVSTKTPVEPNHKIASAPAAVTAGLDFTVTDLQGNKIKLSDYHGKKVMVIFWATWCPPCKAEIPDLIELRKKYTQDQLVMLAISEEPISTVKRFINANKNINYTIAITPSYASLPSPLNKAELGATDPGFPIPKTFYIDLTGKIKYKTMQLTSFEDMVDIIAYLDKSN
jgi:peroxiredoxin